MKLQPVRFGAIDGGQFDALAPTDIPKNGWKRLINLLPYNGRMNLREGYRNFSKNAATISGGTGLIVTTGLLNTTSPLDDYAILVLDRTGHCAFVDQYGQWDSLLSTHYASAMPDDDAPWILRQYKGVVYASRRNITPGLIRIDGAGWERAGRPAPTIGLSSTFVNTGSNVWQWCYTYLDSVTGNESNPSPILSKTTGTSGTVTLTGWSVADTDVVWDKYRLYATKANSGLFFPIADLSSATTTYDFIVADALSGSLAYGSTALSTRNGVPDADTLAFEIWNERGWISEGEKVKYSAPGLIEGYSEIQNLPFNPNDNDTITTLYAWDDFLVIAKRRSTVLLAGYDRTDFEQKLWSDSIGCVAPQSMRNCGGTLVWLSSYGFMRADSSAELPKNTSNRKVESVLSSVDWSRIDLAYACTNPERNLYLVTLPVSGGWTGLAYNWATDSWGEFDYANDPRVIVTAFDPQKNPMIVGLGSANDTVIRYFYGPDDESVTIPWYALSGSPDTGGPNQNGMDEVSLLCDPTHYAVTFRAFRDAKPLVLAERTVRFGGTYGWKSVKLSTKKRLGTTLQVELSGSARGPWSFSDMEWNVLATQQRGRVY